MRQVNSLQSSVYYSDHKSIKPHLTRLIAYFIVMSMKSVLDKDGVYRLQLKEQQYQDETKTAKYCERFF